MGLRPTHQQNLKTMRGAKSNALFLSGAHWNPGCPWIALVICPTFWIAATAAPPVRFSFLPEFRTMADESRDGETQCLRVFPIEAGFPANPMGFWRPRRYNFKPLEGRQVSNL